MRAFSIPDPFNLLYVDMPEDVEAFHEKFGLTYNGPPRMLPPELEKLALTHLHEELDEYEEAVAENDPARAFDALIDLVYVAIGRAYFHGFPWAEGWRRVQEANMAKVRCERAEDSTRGSTYDVIKPEGWVGPDHSDLVDQSKWKCDCGQVVFTNYLTQLTCGECGKEMERI